MAWLRRNGLRAAVHLGSLVPLFRLAWLYASGQLLDPVRQITTGTGRAAIALLVLTLACTPISLVSGWRQVLRARRAVGLYGFLYVMLHFLTFVWWDYGLQLELLVAATLGQTFVVYGLLSLALLIPLAITSTRGWRRRLGRRWQWLHWLFYPASLLAVGHYLLIGKDPAVPIRYAVVVVLLLVLRLPWVQRGLSTLRASARARWLRS